MRKPAHRVEIVATAQTDSRVARSATPVFSGGQIDQQRRKRLTLLLALAIGTGLVLGLGTGASGLSWTQLWAGWGDPETQLILLHIRAPRTLGAALVGALLGLAGALSQGLFRNPLADPYLLGTAAGAGLGVVTVLAGASSLGAALTRYTDWLNHIGLITAAFGGALLGVALTLFLARGAAQTLRLLLAGVVVGVLLGAVSDLITTAVPDALRGKQAFMLGSTSFMGWSALASLSLGLAWCCCGLAGRHARALDALTLGEDSAASLGLDMRRMRCSARATALAVSQAGLVAFVGLVAPHLVRRARTRPTRLAGGSPAPPWARCC
jgi:iron complex transport system permease protein